MSSNLEIQTAKRTGKLDFLYDYYLRGIPLNQVQINSLIKAGYIETTKGLRIRKEKELLYQVADTEVRSKDQIEADRLIDVINEEDLPPELDTESRIVILSNETYDKIQETSLFYYSGSKEITKEDWLPRSVMEHTKDFIMWINSINSGFQSQIRYDKFAKYCQQARNWLDDKVDLSDLDDLDKRDYMAQEADRCRENTLYFMDKYLQVKEGDEEGGNMKYLSKPVHKILCYLIDCGYSLMAGKPRQIAATTTIGGIALCKLITRKNYFIKFITMDKETGTEIFEDKIKAPFGELPAFMKPSVSNYRDNLFRMSRKTNDKGTKGGVNSTLRVVAPSYAAINGGAPQLVLIDEAGYVSILGRMMREGRPTMFKYNPKTGKTEMKRQVIIWGTGGEMDKGGKAYENEFMDAMDKWNKGEHSYGIIPLFFDWTTRPGVTKTLYDQEKKAATKTGPEKEAAMVQFRQAFPSTLEDMFLTSYKLLVGIDWINKQRERIKMVEHEIKPVSGYFEPIYDESQPNKETDELPFAIIGAKFIPLDDLEDNMDLATVQLLEHPKADWVNRYYQGTDPIATDNGYSNMASVIWDAVYQIPVCIMDYREPDYKNVFLQSLLMGLYFGAEKLAVQDLVEINIGAAYCDFKESNGQRRSILHRTELPDMLSGGGSMYGIDNRGTRAKIIVNKLFELLKSNGENFYFDVIFKQLRTYACTYTEKGNEIWGVSNYKTEKDDVLYALVFSYICALSNLHKVPYNVQEAKKKSKPIRVLARNKEGNLYYKTVGNG